MMDIGTLCRETISFIYNLVRVSILSVALVGMKCADLESLYVSVSRMASDISLKLSKSGNQLRFLIQRDPSGRTSNALSIPRRVMTNALTRSGLIRSFWLKASAITFAFLGWCSRRCPILNCFNLGGVNVNSLAVNHVPEKLHNTDPEITFGELDI
ncbi:hypothetical protein Tco_0141046 [Tanacetum coccineum]